MHGPSDRLEVLDGLQHARVLDRGGDDLLPFLPKAVVGAPRTSEHLEHGIVRFRAASGKNDFIRLGVKKGRHALADMFNPVTGAPARFMQTGRIGV